MIIKHCVQWFKGPTSVEFAAEMYDFLGSDIKRTYPDIVHHSSIILVEATDHLLSAFDQKLSGYVTDLYKKRPAMTVYTGTTVKQLSENVQAFIDHITGMKPAGVKGNYIKGISISATMSPGIRIAA